MSRRMASEPCYCGDPACPWCGNGYADSEDEPEQIAPGACPVCASGCERCPAGDDLWDAVTAAWHKSRLLPHEHTAYIAALDSYRHHVHGPDRAGVAS